MQSEKNMENSELSMKEDQEQQEVPCLPDFFRKEFPNLSKFLGENLLRNLEKKYGKNSIEN